MSIIALVGVESEIASFSKFAAAWYRKTPALEITVRKLLCSIVVQTFFFFGFFFLTCTSTGSLSDQFYQVSIANRL